MLTLPSHECTVLVIDMQTRLLPAVADSERVQARACRLARAAGLLEVPVIATEHWVDKIGPTAPRLQPWIARSLQKTHFDATRESGFADWLPRERHRILLMGVEAHVCVLQTGLGLAGMGYAPILVSDCIASRDPDDRSAALARWMHHGLEAVSSEMAMFEWLDTPAHPRFKDVLALIKGDASAPSDDKAVSNACT